MTNSVHQLQSSALRAYVKLARATETVTSNIHRHLANDGLTISQFGVLEALLHLGSLTLGDLGKKILRTSANLTTVVDNLEKRALVVRQRTTADRRQILVHLSPEGKALVSRLFPVHAEIVGKEMGILTMEELETLGKICKKLGKKE